MDNSVNTGYAVHVAGIHSYPTVAKVLPTRAFSSLGLPVSMMPYSCLNEDVLALAGFFDGLVFATAAVFPADFPAGLLALLV